MRKAILTASALAALVTGCGGSGGQHLKDTTGDDGGGDPGDGGPGAMFNNGDGAAAFSVSIEGSANAVLSKVSLSCTGDCVDVTAVTHGGTGPYTFTWNDGTTGASRHFCPMSSSTVSVSATDSAMTGELASGPQTVMASLDFHCLGSTAPDAGGTVCIPDPSFEGKPSALGIDVLSAMDAPPWVSCHSSGAGIVNASSAVGTETYPAPTDGQTYLGLASMPPSDSFCGCNGDVAEPLCEPLHAGTTYNLKLDIHTLNPNGVFSHGQLTLVGDTSSCVQGQTLWTSPPVPEAWQTYCATFTPTQDVTYLELFATEDSSATEGGQLMVDNMVPVPSCDGYDNGADAGH